MSNRSPMAGRVCLVTGANTGIGKETAAGLARQGATVIMVCRDRHKGDAARRDIVVATGNTQVQLLIADLASLAQVRQLAQSVRATYPRLHVLINNAGIWSANRRESVDGYELTFAVNHLAPFLLTLLLQDHLVASAPARVITLSSSLHASGSIHWDDLQLKHRYDANVAYSQSKLANVMFTFALVRRLPADSVTANCLHPGVVATELAREMPASTQASIASWASNPAQGARASVYLATAPEVAHITGRYFDEQRAARATAQANEEGAQERLWQISRQLVQPFLEP